jgi:hypothetical protein
VARSEPGRVGKLGARALRSFEDADAPGLGIEGPEALAVPGEAVAAAGEGRFGPVEEVAVGQVPVGLLVGEDLPDAPMEHGGVTGEGLSEDVPADERGLDGSTVSDKCHRVVAETALHVGLPFPGGRGACRKHRREGRRRKDANNAKPLPSHAGVASLWKIVRDRLTEPVAGTKRASERLRADGNRGRIIPPLDRERKRLARRQDEVRLARMAWVSRWRMQ